MTAVPTPATVWHPVQSGTTTRKGHTVPTPFAQQAEEAMLTLTFSQHGASWASREYKRKHSQRKNTRRMLQDSQS